MKKEIRDMIRQKQVTGEKVGQIMIRDLVTLYQRQRELQDLNAQDLNAQPLTETEKAQLVSALGTPEEIAVYSQYKYVINYLQQVSLYHSVAFQDVEIGFLRLYSALAPLDDNEQLLGVIHRFPKLMEEHEYEQTVAEEAQRRREITLSGEQLVMGMYRWLCHQPDSRTYDEARLAMVGVDYSSAAPHTFIYTLSVRVPEVYQFVLESLGKFPAFSSNNLTLQYPQQEVEAYFPGLTDALFGSPEYALYPYGYAIPRRGAEPYDPMEIEGIGVVYLLDNLGDQLTQVYQLFLHACRHTLAIEEAVRLLALRVEVPELQHFLKPAQVSDRLTQLASLTGGLSGLPQEMSIAESAQLEQQVRQLFPPVTMERLVPTERTRQNALKALSDLTLLERPAALHQLLLDEGGVVIAP